MQENASPQRVGEVAREIPSTQLPPAVYEDLPEPLPLRKVLGPGVVSIGIGVSSGELIIWPYITSQVGLIFLWAAVLGVLTQWFINMEIERYTLATGETAITGFSRFWKPWGIVFCLCAILPNAWPGVAASGATILTFAIGFGNPTLITIIALVSLALALTISPVVYQTLEKVEFAKVGAVLLFLAVAVVVVVSPQAWADLPGATARGFGRIPDLPVSLILGAAAFAGAGGVHNLIQSNWIRDKGYGMGARIPRLVSPVTGEDQATPSTGYLFPQTEENLRRWRGWWRVANTEQLVTFFALGTLSIFLMSMIAYSTVYGQNIGEDLDFFRNEGRILGETVGGWFERFFYITGAISLLAGAMGILDYVGRCVADVLKVSYLAESQVFTESRIYALTVWLLVAVSIANILTFSDQPIVLLLVQSSLSGIVMFVYSILLIWLNRRALPHPIKIRGARLGALVWAVLAFGILSVILVYTQIADLLGG
ncbi:MAG: Nramp family divalent metal transporter [Rubrobacter sp.]